MSHMSHMNRVASLRSHRSRRGFLLPIVLVITAMLTLAVTIFSEQMLAEYRVTRTLASQLQAANAAQSGVLYVQNLARNTDHTSHVQQLDVSLFQFRQLDPAANSGFWIASGRTKYGASPHYGLENESGKLNLNGLPTDLANVEAVRLRLMHLPQMTPAIADALMDWIDADDAPRPFGAERQWYSAAQAARLPAQRPFRELSELLDVRGITVALLYGEDRNANGWLDECENDGDITEPIDNADGLLDRGWSQYLSVTAAESNYGAASQLKVNLNGKQLASLYDQLQSRFGQTAAAFVVALRLEGPRQRGNVDKPTDESALAERVRSAPKRLKDQLDKVSQANAARRSEVRGGLDLSAEPNFVILSMVDLIDQEVLTLVDGQQTLLKSPWGAQDLGTALSKLEQHCTTSDSPALLQRIDIHSAALPVLVTVPGLNATTAAAIIARRDRHAGAGSVGWLVNEGILSLEQLRGVAPYITTGGDVLSGTAIGTTEGSASLLAVHFTLDNSGPKVRVLQSQDTMPFTLPPNERPKQ